MSKLKDVFSKGVHKGLEKEAHEQRNRILQLVFENKGEFRIIGADKTIRKEYINRRGDSVYRTYYKGGRIKKEVELKGSMLDGCYRLYNLDGEVIKELVFKNDRLKDIVS